MTRNDLTFTQQRITYDTALIDVSESATVSSAIQLDGVVPIGIITPAAMTGTAIKFQFSHDDLTFTALYDTSGSEVSITSAASRWIALDKEDFLSAKSIKLVSGSSEAADRSIIVVLMRA